MKHIATCLWFDSQAAEATQFYKSIFPNAKITAEAFYSEENPSGKKPGSLMTVEMQLENLEILALNGGPFFKFSPSQSFFVNCKDAKEAKSFWDKLSAGGTVRMGFDKYPWNEAYGWTADKFGVEWQVIVAPSNERLKNSFLFVDALFGKGEEAITYWTSIFPNSKIDSLTKDEKSNSVMHSNFKLNGQTFSLMEGAGKHGHTFTSATSLYVLCDTQAEIDMLWDKLSAGGKVEQCGWLKDKYGVSWQVVPAQMSEYMRDPIKAKKVMELVMKMIKLDMATIDKAANSN